MLIDDAPESVIIWYRDDLPRDTVAEMLATVWKYNANRGMWRRGRQLRAA